MAARCLRNVKPEDVPPIMAVVQPWRCGRPRGHRGPCCVTTRRIFPPPPLRPVKVPYEGSA